MSFQRHFLAGVAGGVIDFAEASLADAAFDRVSIERPRTAGVRKFHGRGPGFGRGLQLGGWEVHRILTHYF